jgi:hypothetical protein
MEIQLFPYLHCAPIIFSSGNLNSIQVRCRNTGCKKPPVSFCSVGTCGFTNGIILKSTLASHKAPPFRHVNQKVIVLAGGGARSAYFYFFLRSELKSNRLYPYLFVLLFVK